MKKEIEKTLRETSIDYAMDQLLERSHRGERFNLYDELEKLGFSWQEIAEAGIRKTEQLKEEFEELTKRIESLL